MVLLLFVFFGELCEVFFKWSFVFFLIYFQVSRCYGFDEFNRHSNAVSCVECPEVFLYYGFVFALGS